MNGIGQTAQTGSWGDGLGFVCGTNGSINIRAGEEGSSEID